MKQELSFYRKYIFVGKYPGTHGIIGNQFWDHKSQTVPYHKSQSQNREFFDYMDENSTGNIKWFFKHEPIWATAMMQGANFSAFLWAR